MRIYNGHSVSCQCPWCADGWDSFGEDDILLIDTREMKQCWQDEEPDTVKNELDYWLR